jgi:hypothetical protein
VSASAHTAKDVEENHIKLDKIAHWKQNRRADKRDRLEALIKIASLLSALPFCLIQHAALPP